MDRYVSKNAGASAEGSMRKIFLVFFFVTLAGCLALPAQTPSAQSATPPPPQSARQALIEMFLGKGQNDFQKHIPDAACQTLIHKGDDPDTSVILKISTIGRQMVAQGQHIETFDEGPTLLVSQETNGNEKIEVLVDHDSLMGENDEIELAINYYKDGQLQSLPVIPRLTFTFAQEKEIWKLTEIVAAAHVPLTDPDYLKGLRQQQDEANESAARMHVTVIAGAETNYAAKHPDRGYACSLSNLFAPDATAGTEGGGAYYAPEFANEESGGYRFTIGGCEGTPASKYRITAVPIDTDSTLKTFCSDESGTLKFVTGGKSSTCFSRGQPANSAGPSTTTED
jgi:hypothetical protein